MARQAEDVSSGLQRNKGEKWYECDICGWPFRDSELRVNKGKKVCFQCYDELGHKETRP